MTSTSPQIGPPPPLRCRRYTRRAVLTWLAVFPAIPLMQFVVSRYIGGWPLVARTFMVTAVAVARRCTCWCPG